MSQSFCYSYANFYANCYYNFNPWGIFEKMTSFSSILNPDLEQGKINGRGKFSEIKAQKT